MIPLVSEKNIKNFGGVKMAEVFEVSGGVKIRVGDEVVEVETLTVDVLKKTAKERGIKKFIVVRDGEELTAADFPISDGEVEIKPYYEAK